MTSHQTKSATEEGEQHKRAQKEPPLTSYPGFNIFMLVLLTYAGSVAIYAFIKTGHQANFLIATGIILSLWFRFFRSFKISRRKRKRDSGPA